MIWYDMTWYDMIYDMIYDVMWYDIWYDMIHIWNDMIWYDIWYDILCDMIWYMIYDMIWYDMIYDDIIPHGYELSWVRVVLGTSCRGYELSWVWVVLGTSCLRYELSWVRFVLGTSFLGYELSWVRVVQIPCHLNKPLGYQYTKTKKKPRKTVCIILGMSSYLICADMFRDLSQGPAEMRLNLTRVINTHWSHQLHTTNWCMVIQMTRYMGPDSL